MNRRLAVLLPLLLVLPGCTTSAAGPTVPAGPPPPYADCATLTAAPVADPTAGQMPADRAGQTPTGPSDGPVADRTVAAELAGLSLPCFGGGEPIALNTLPGPLVINLWASWCRPCREELPAFQRLAQRTAGELRVLGVNTFDNRQGAESVAVDFGLTFPNLYDPQEQLRLRLARTGMPITLFIDRQGKIRYLHNAGALDDASLAELVRRHLDVEAPA